MKHTVCRIIPTYLLKELMEQQDERELQGHLFNTITLSERLRARREIIGSLSAMFPMASARQRNIHDAHNGMDETASTLVLSEGGPSVGDNVVKEVYDSFGYTYDLYSNVYGRRSIDDHDMPLNGFVHWGMKFMNAFWDGKAMYFGDGDGKIIKSFTSAIDIAGHELTHGVTQYEAALEYWCDQTHQPGALNESMFDCVGSMVKQYALQQTVDNADWLIGQGIFVKDPTWALRSMKKPGTAYPNDRQPSHMRDYVNLPNDQDHDEGGVHINSGIPNYAFYLAATKIGGKVWEKTGLVWYKTLSSGLPTDCSFEIFASHTVQVAGNLFGQDSSEQKAIRDAWAAVGVAVSGLTAMEYISRKVR